VRRTASLVLALMLPAVAGANGKFIVAVSVPPQAGIVSHLAGDSLGVMELVPKGGSPHTYEPTPRQLALLAQARVYFRIGLPFENGIVEKIRANNPQLKIVDMQKGVPLLRGCDHDHGKAQGHVAHDHDHAHGEREGDPHIWLDPQRVEIQARTATEALIAIDPEDRERYVAGLDRFLAQLEALDLRISGRLAPYKGRTFMVHHPAFGYFAERYGLKQVAVQTGGKEPGARHVAELIRRARAEQVRVIFVQTGFSRTSAEVIAREIDGVVREMDPLHYDILANLECMAAAIEEALKR